MARFFGMLSLANRVEYFYGNRVSQQALEFYRQFIPEGSLCFDVGSHQGLKADLFAQLGAKVVAVEPHPMCCVELRRKFAQNKNVFIEEAGCGPAIGENELQIFELNPQLSTVLKSHPHAREAACEKSRSHPISIVTLDFLIEKYGCPAFCKIDAEGYEVEIFRGLNHPIAGLQFEFSGDCLEAANACLDCLFSIQDYQLNYRVEGSLHFGTASWLDRAELRAQLERLPASSAGDIFCQVK